MLSSVEGLNFKHLMYFLRVARVGSLVRASGSLGLAPSTVSAQIRTLEQSLGVRLFERRNRGVALTDVGREVLPYVEEIFGLGIDIEDVIQGRAPGRSKRLVVGVTTALHKVLTPILLAPVFRLPDPVRLDCREGRLERMLSELAGHGLDIVLSDSPAPSKGPIRVFNHLLGESGTTFFAAEKLAEAHRSRFPQSLDGAPVLLPSAASPLRHSLDQWFSAVGVRPRVVAEFEDNAILKAFGETGLGIFTGPTVIAAEIRHMYRALQIGRVDGVRERYYAITVGRRIQNPAVAAITDAAREKLSG